MKTILFILLILSFTSCVTQSRCDRKFPPQESTVTTYNTVTRDSIALRYDSTAVYYPVPFLQIKDSIAIRYENGRTMSDKLILKGNFSEAIVQVQNGKLYGTLTEKGVMNLRVKVIMQDHYIKTLQSTTEKSKEVIREKYIPKWVKIFAICFGIELILLVLLIGVWIYLKFTKIKITPFG